MKRSLFPMSVFSKATPDNLWATPTSHRALRWGRILLALLPCGTLSFCAESGPPVPEVTHGTIVATIPVGDSGIHYRGTDGHADLVEQGPQALAVDATGAFWIADTVSARLLRVSASGQLLANIDAANELDHPIDLSAGPRGSAVENQIVVLDVGEAAPRIVKYSLDGKRLAMADLPSSWRAGAHAVRLLADGRIAIDDVRAPGARYLIQLQPDGSFTYQTTSSVFWGPDNGPDRSWSAAPMQPVDPRNQIMEKEQLAALPDGRRIFLVGEHHANPDFSVTVDVTVRSYDRAGQLLGLARVPVRDQLALIESRSGVAVDESSGAVYALLTKREGVELRRLIFSSELTPLPAVLSNNDLPAASAAQPLAEAALTPARNICDMVNVGNVYVCNSITVPASAVPNDGSSIGRTRPSYMSSAGGSYGVPYSYGGFDTVSNFQIHMSAATTTVGKSYKAGDVDTTQEFYSKGPGSADWGGKPFFGVDCSGFVSRCWGLTTKQSATTLLSYVASTSPPTYWQGDILDRPGVHVLMYIDTTTAPSTTGSYMFNESAGAPYGPKLSMHKLSDYYAMGYAHYRYAGAVSTGTCTLACSR